MAGKDTNSPPTKNALSTLTKDKGKQPEREKADENAAAQTTGDKTAKNKATLVKPEELNEEDQKLKDNLDMLVERLLEADSSLYLTALESIKNLIKTSTSSMTAVPKPLKFLRPHYDKLAAAYEKWPKSDEKLSMADMLSVLGMTYTDQERHDTLKYRLLSPSKDIGSWGFEYVRHLALEIGLENYIRREKGMPPGSDLLNLALQLVPFFLKHSSEADAVDLLVELNSVVEIKFHVDEINYKRVCNYMVSMAPLLAIDQEDALNTAYEMYEEYEQWTQAMAVAIRLGNPFKIDELLNNPSVDTSMRRQMALILARQRIVLEEFEEKWQEKDPQLVNCLNNAMVSELFRETLAKELNLGEPKIPDDIYKTHLEISRAKNLADTNSSSHNLSKIFVNAFVNLGFCNDKLMMPEDDKSSWVWKTDPIGQVSAVASIGALMQWYGDEGLDLADRYLQSDEAAIQSGGILTLSLMNCGVRSLIDATLAVLTDEKFVEQLSADQRMLQVMGLGIAYAGTNSEMVLNQILPFIQPSESGHDWEMQVRCMAALSAGLISVGSGNGEILGDIMHSLITLDLNRPKMLKSKWTRFMALGVGLLCFGGKDNVDVITETLKAIGHPVSQACLVLARVCAYAGTGEVVEVQTLLNLCSEPVGSKYEAIEEVAEEKAKEKASQTNVSAEQKEKDAKDAAAAKEKVATDRKYEELSQSYAVLGLGLVTMGEDVGKEMILRQFGHLMHYGEPHIRKAVPLAMALVSISHPQMKIYETLSRYSHDNDLAVAINAIFAMGLVGAGTNNARLAQLLRHLASYYYKDQHALFVVRVAQGFLHMSKGTVTLNPFHTDRQILSRVSAAGLLSIMVSMIDAQEFVLENARYLFFLINLSVQPRWLMTLDEELQPLKVNVRVGQAVDVVGQAGVPKTITGWQTQSTPVLLAYGERAELEDERYISLASVLEGIVILRKNPEWEGKEEPAPAPAKTT